VVPDDASPHSARACQRVLGLARPDPKLTQKQQAELVRGVQEERYTQAEAARLFSVHPATVSRLMAGQPRR
jgi:hypothetical protein